MPFLHPTLARRLGSVLCVSAVCLAASPAPAAPAADVPPQIRTGHWGFDAAGQDMKVRPGDDFFRYANGGFLDALDIPADRSRFGIDYILAATAEARVRTILEATDAPPPAAAADAQRTRALYRAFMDEAKVEALGARPLAPDLAQVRAVASRTELAALMGRAQINFQSAIFGLSIGPDAKSPDAYAVGLGQDGLGLPDRDYYLQPQFAAQKAKYHAYIAQMLRLAGWPGADAQADAVLAFETEIAKVSWAREDERDPDRTYNPTTVAELEKAAPGFPWRVYLDAAELPRVTRVIVAEKTALPKIAALYAATPLPVLKAWAAFHLADSAAPFLPDAFDAAHFAFHGTVLTGQPQQRARWKRAVDVDNLYVGEAVGRVYVAQYFPPEAKAKIAALVENLRIALRARILRLDWMSPATKQAALVKLDKLNVKLAYPDKWRDYSGLVLTPDDLYGDVERATAFEWRRQVRRLDQPVDRAEWQMTPQTVNAYYNPTANEIVFPAAQLQAPYFDVGFDLAANYGGIGAVIGHEMTHGFDDEGRKFNGDGALADWWTPADAAGFDKRTAVLGAQYDAYSPYAGVHVNGKLTMGENIADLGGVLIALDAYHAALGAAPAKTVDGLSGDQRFFLAYGQSWREKAREDSVRKQLVDDPHSPEAYRVNGVVRNVDGWYAGFGVQPGDKLYLPPAARARIW
ncbi:MAG: M13 family metallopeptidase [Caulobacteraceae bacterium]